MINMVLKVFIIFRCGEKRTLKIKWEDDNAEIPSVTNIMVLGSSGTLMTAEGSLIQWSPTDVIFIEVIPETMKERTIPTDLLQPMAAHCEVCSYELIAEPEVVGDEIVFRGKCPQCLALFENSCPAEDIPNIPE